jgi:hypothetical protein
LAAQTQFNDAVADFAIPETLVSAYQMKKVGSRVCRGAKVMAVEGKDGGSSLKKSVLIGQIS